ncbi:MAG: TetR/AcrR family transcriptional regulator [Cytophagaceae bacterium]|jgi:AcrR family transcriptional regulator|nr:TetR/AcrR family transcriptional regulator [Cytophagaceae bacterium]
MKEYIIEESVELFKQQGVKSTTMDDIARHMSISKRTIYENFKDKEELLTAAVNYLLREDHKFSEKVFEQADNVIEAIIELLREGAERARKQKYYFFVMDIKKFYPKIYKELLTRNECQNQKKMQQLVELGILQKVFRDDLNPEIIGYVFNQQAAGFLLRDENLESFSIYEMFKNMTIAFIRGLCTPKGIEILNRRVELMDRK